MLYVGEGGGGDGSEAAAGAGTVEGSLRTLIEDAGFRPVSAVGDFGRMRACSRGLGYLLHRVSRAEFERDLNVRSAVVKP